jgi:hypothetical protein
MGDLNNSLITKMERIVNQYVKAYQNDFIDDKRRVLSESSIMQYLWIVKPTGTFLLGIADDEDVLNDIDTFILFHRINLPATRFFLVDITRKILRQVNDIQSIRCLFNNH